MTPEVLRTLLERSWSRYTSADPNDWSPDVPSTGQCAVTALIGQEWLGGSILRARIRGGDSHYWNVLPDGTEVDLTADQFDNDTPPLTDEPEPRTVYELLANERTHYRWLGLRLQFESALIRAVDGVESARVTGEEVR